MPVNATPLRDETATRNAGLGLTAYSLNGLPLRRFFNTSGMLYREMELAKRLPDLDDQAQYDLLATDGMLVKRPLLVTEATAIPGFKEATWAEALGL